MTTMMRYAGLPLKYEPSRSLSVRGAKVWGVSPGAASGLIYGERSVFRRNLVFGRDLIRDGLRSTFEHLNRDILALLTTAPRPSLCTALVLAEADASAAVVRARAAFQAHPQLHQAIETFEKALRRHEQTERDLCSALAGAESE